MARGRLVVAVHSGEGNFREPASKDNGGELLVLEPLLDGKGALVEQPDDVWVGGGDGFQGRLNRAVAKGFRRLHVYGDVRGAQQVAQACQLAEEVVSGLMLRRGRDDDAAAWGIGLRGGGIEQDLAAARAGWSFEYALAGEDLEGFAYAVAADEEFFREVALAGEIG